MNAKSIKVSEDFRITIPEEVRQALGVKPGDELIVDVLDGMLVLLANPDDFTGSMGGLHREIWQGIDTTAYLNEERAAWSISEDK